MPTFYEEVELVFLIVLHKLGASTTFRFVVVHTFSYTVLQPHQNVVIHGPAIANITKLNVE